MPPLTGVGLIGGGRWARVTASVLDAVLAGQVPVTLCSPANPTGWRGWSGRPSWTQVARMEEVLEKPCVSHVLIARRACDHASTTLAALAAGKAVLVEKPFSLTQADCARVVAAADGHLCLTGLVFLHAPNLQRFGSACRSAGAISHVDIVWSDPIEEIRHGERKAHDYSLNVVQDILPHAWSLIQTVSPTRELHLASVDCQQGGQSVRLTLAGPGLSVSVQLRRGFDRRERILRVVGHQLSAQLDFTVEPGQAVLNEQPLDVTQDFSSPLAAQLRAFLHGPANPLSSVKAAAEAVALSQAALALIRPAQAAAVREGLAPGAGDLPRTAACYALRELSAGGVDGAGVGMSVSGLAAWAGLGTASEQEIVALLSRRGDARKAASSDTS